MIVGKDDTICSREDALWTRDQLTHLKKDYLEYSEIDGSHFRFTNSHDLSYFTEVIDVLHRFKPTKGNHSYFVKLAKSQFTYLILVAAVAGLVFTTVSHLAKNYKPMDLQAEEESAFELLS